MMKTIISTCSVFCFCLNLLCSQTSSTDEALAPLEAQFAQSDLVCRLTGPELLERKLELEKYVYAKVKNVEEVPDGYVFHFDDEKDFTLNLIDYILAEKECCPFFKQDISIQPNNGGISWMVSGSPEIKQMLKGLIENR